MISGAIAEGFGLLMIVPLAAIAINGGEGAALRFAPWAAGWSSDQRFTFVLVLFLGAMAARSLLLFARDLTLAKLGSNYDANLQLRAAATLARRGWTFASRIGQSGMQSLLLNDVPRAGQAIVHVQQIAVAATMLAVQLALTFLLSPGLTLLAVAFLALAFAISVRSSRRTAKSGFAISEALEESAGSGFRLHSGLKAALAQGTVPAFVDEYRTGLGRTAAQFIKLARDYHSSRQLAAFGAALAAAVLLFVGVRVLALPFPVLAASLILFARMSGPAQLLQNSAFQASAYAPAFAAIERRLGKLERNTPERTSLEPLDWRGLELECVRFEHSPDLGVSEASLRLERGQWLGLSGASGAGKTTLVDLVAGLLSPQSGQVSIDGQPLNGETLERWRSTIAYAAQEGSVFNDTVRGNLLAEGAHAKDADLWHFLDVVGLLERVRGFPLGLDESVGDRGSRLSGGERQRLVLARALLRRPGLLILDEATSALDEGSEAELIERMKGLEPRSSALVVAHRKSTLGHCDLVLRIQHGIVKQAGEALARPK